MDSAFSNFFSMLFYGVSLGSVLCAMAPSVNPQIDTSSGTFNPTSLQEYKIPEAVSSLMAKKPSGGLLFPVSRE